MPAATPTSRRPTGAERNPAQARRNWGHVSSGQVARTVRKSIDDSDAILISDVLRSALYCLSQARRRTSDADAPSSTPAPLPASVPARVPRSPARRDRPTPARSRTRRRPDGTGRTGSSRSPWACARPPACSAGLSSWPQLVPVNETMPGRVLGRQRAGRRRARRPGARRCSGGERCRKSPPEARAAAMARLWLETATKLTRPRRCSVRAASRIRGTHRPVPVAEEQHVRVIVADAPERALDAPGEGRAQARVRLDDQHEPIARRREVAQGVREARRTPRAPVHVRHAGLDGTFDRRGRHAVRRTDPQRPDRDARPSKRAVLESHLRSRYPAPRRSRRRPSRSPNPEPLSRNAAQSSHTPPPP